MFRFEEIHIFLFEIWRRLTAEVAAAPIPVGSTAAAPAAVDEVVEGEGDEAAVVAHHRGVADHLQSHQQTNIDYFILLYSFPSSSNSKSLNWTNVVKQDLIQT